MIPSYPPLSINESALSNNPLTSGEGKENQHLSFVWQNFKLIETNLPYQRFSDILSHAKILLIGEYHLIDNHKKFNAELIERLWKDDSFILTEDNQNGQLTVSDQLTYLDSSPQANTCSWDCPSHDCAQGVIYHFLIYLLVNSKEISDLQTQKLGLESLDCSLTLSDGGEKALGQKVKLERDWKNFKAKWEEAVDLFDNAIYEIKNRKGLLGELVFSLKEANSPCLSQLKLEEWEAACRKPSCLSLTLQLKEIKRSFLDSKIGCKAIKESILCAESIMMQLLRQQWIEVCRLYDQTYEELLLKNFSLRNAYLAQAAIKAAESFKGTIFGIAGLAHVKKVKGYPKESHDAVDELVSALKGKNIPYLILKARKEKAALPDELKGQIDCLANWGKKDASFSPQTTSSQTVQSSLQAKPEINDQQIFLERVHQLIQQLNFDDLNDRDQNELRNLLHPVQLSIIHDHASYDTLDWVGR